ncbi:hypothetical protein Tb927.2.1600 [Trypanosoma brucei brucei TREU927]|uniref:Invariant surface glycoprotein n=1 Tax=Trypanosoma brucei brucei (strain 927/4 GUTat10.1) TaxID=185431 RepID=Q585R8_TRYB2|nr:hypothetical protein Tb927.2.1600 [Trypanosoma brucei brucei TREU927]AAQ15618.1 hypothetical protein Tb927.2.1600 [Trypanosoma brucei brucei TREU927]AAX79542.1 hypothetical protein Tb927.2.1600 [Trypanosoma brucei]
MASPSDSREILNTLGYGAALVVPAFVKLCLTMAVMALDDQQPAADTGYRYRNDLKLPAARALCRLKEHIEKVQERVDQLSKMVEGNKSLGRRAMELAEEVKSEAAKSARGLSTVLSTHCRNPDENHHLPFSQNCDRSVSPIEPPDHKLKEEITCDATVESGANSTRGPSSRDMNNLVRMWDEVKPTASKGADGNSYRSKQSYEAAASKCKIDGYSTMPCTVSEKHWRSSFVAATLKLRELEVVVEEATGQTVQEVESKPQGIPRGLELGLEEATAGPTVQFLLGNNHTVYDCGTLTELSRLVSILVAVQI